MTKLLWPIRGVLERAFHTPGSQVNNRALRANSIFATIDAFPVEPDFILGETRPDATNTGVPYGRPLQDITGELTLSGNGSILENKRIFGRVLVRAENVTIRNCEIVGRWTRTSGSGGIIDCNHVSAKNVLIERCTLRCEVPSLPLGTGIIGHDYISRRNHIYNVTDYFGVYNNNDGFREGPTNVVLEGNYGHDFSFISPEPGQPDNRTHNDGVQIQGGTGTVIRGNHLVALSSDTFGSGGSKDVPAPNPYHPFWGSVIVITPNVSQIRDLVIEDNWFYGGFRGVGIAVGKYAAVSVGSIRNNIFGRERAAYSLGGVYGTKDVVYQNGMSSAGVDALRDTQIPDPNGNVYEDGQPITIQFRSSV